MVDGDDRGGDVDERRRPYRDEQTRHRNSRRDIGSGARPARDREPWGAGAAGLAWIPPLADGYFGVDAREAAVAVHLDHAERLVLPLVVIGIEPGATSTTSATETPCPVETADATSPLTVCRFGDVGGACVLVLTLSDHDQRFGRVIGYG